MGMGMGMGMGIGMNKTHNTSIRSSIMLILAIMILFSLGNSYFVFQTEKNTNEKFMWVSHTNEVILGSERFLSHLKDAETGQRGFLLTANISYLTPYDIGINEVRKSFKKILELTSDNPQQQKRLIAVNKLMAKKLEELAKTIKLASTNQQEQALQIVKSNSGKDTMDQIRSQVEAFVDMEILLLNDRLKDFMEHSNNLKFIVYLQVFGTTILAIFTWFFIKRMLIDPLYTLVHLTEKMQKGEKLSVDNILKKDEMGFLISSFFKMNETIHSYTKELIHQAHFDELTNLPNRTFAYEALNESTTKQKNTNFKTAVCFLDLNKFKIVNDKYGHDIGDELLKIAAQRLQTSIRDEDVACRLGGDEFLVILNNITNHGQIELVLEGIIKAFADPVIIKGEHIELSTSIGVSIFPDDSKNDSQLLKYADLAMYRSKTNSKHFSFFNKKIDAG